MPSRRPDPQVLPTPLVEFRVKPSYRSRLWFTVRVFDTVQQLRVAHGIYTSQGTAYYRRAEGACSRWVGIEDGEIGIMSFHKGKLGSEVVSHECTHAGLAAMHRLRVLTLVTGDIGGKHAEMLCYAVGYMTRQVYARLYEVGILK